MSVPVETERPEPSSIRTILPTGSPPRPTATATLRPRTLEQRMSEGQIGTQSQDDEDSEENDTLEPLVMEVYLMSWDLNGEFYIHLKSQE